MKARLVRYYKKMLLLCANGTYDVADNDVLKRLFVGFGGAAHFRGKDGRWDTAYETMEEHPGKSLAWVDDEGHLTIAENVFFPLMAAVVEDEYITVQEYAKISGRSEARVKLLCAEGRIPGVMKKGNRWFIPRTSELPPDARFTGVEK